MAGPIFQNLSDFIADPFGRGSADIPREWITNADRYILQKKIRMMKILTYQDCYYYNVEVPSESNPSVHYDVVIQFIPPNKEIAGKKNVPQYYVKFFSNSPSFVYKYAGLYSAYGFLIEPLADKLGEGIKQIPEKTNPTLEMSYDKSIFFAARLIMKNHYYLQVRDSLFIMHTTNLKAFVQDVLEFKTVMSNIETANLEKSVQKNIEKDKKRAESEYSSHRPPDIHRKNPTSKKHAVMSTVNSLPPKVNKRVAKIAAKKATRSTKKS